MKKKTILLICLVIIGIIGVKYQTTMNKSGLHTYSEAITVQRIDKTTLTVIADSHFKNDKIKKGSKIILDYDESNPLRKSLYIGKSMILSFTEGAKITYSNHSYHLTNNFWLREISPKD
ncbi:TPA: hypothetical protein TUD09_002096 [Streptococcus equi subsp. zooepidemicus]|uniref:Uncharacterized protein n=1 Tax=Streptococcus equi subsp. ruminatorum CECT 5772 TaxID=1051981 RepID=A0A922NTI5_9STRE|nr:hypothetical protein [Streptococcus equi]HEL0245849.1 hypothetical protein [Streptococcus equi subsp. zooepidemicus]HEL1010987.1 hypothetical protein [Streptococcus equi subsp. ruminatorum]KED03946.1 hypothetical protein CECT5772_07479 [Streptococcus equi subsp. ruminatorum CECT 5772]HEL0247752.1 hypothetical protein [Streptococcus equi subsp. zooepidemicus]HEL1012955.1 hypothetical protein [Streptococcus equi subsp. ruminatorum]